ncbi:MAG: hypothetical protein ACPG7F_06740 [Aggregatilineales bacterium]
MTVKDLLVNWQTAIEKSQDATPEVRTNLMAGDSWTNTSGSAVLVGCQSEEDEAW